MCHFAADGRAHCTRAAGKNRIPRGGRLFNMSAAAACCLLLYTFGGEADRDFGAFNFKFMDALRCIYKFIDAGKFMFGFESLIGID